MNEIEEHTAYPQPHFDCITFCLLQRYTLDCYTGAHWIVTPVQTELLHRTHWIVTPVELFIIISVTIVGPSICWREREMKLWIIDLFKIKEKLMLRYRNISSSFL